MNTYKLDPLHYYTAPGLSWDALLKYTKIDLELLTDIDMHLFIEKGMHGAYVWCQNDMQKQTIHILQIIILTKKTTT